MDHKGWNGGSAVPLDDTHDDTNTRNDARSDHANQISACCFNSKHKAGDTGPHNHQSEQHHRKAERSSRPNFGFNRANHHASYDCKQSSKCVHPHPNRE